MSEAKRLSMLVYDRCEDPKRCPGHLGRCTHNTGSIACRACIVERKQVGIVWCDEKGSPLAGD